MTRRKGYSGSIICRRCGRARAVPPSEMGRLYCSKRCYTRAQTGVKRRTVPLYVTCQRPGCEGIRQVSRPHLQRSGKYCSRRCAAIVAKNIAKTDKVAAARKSAQSRRAKILQRLTGMTPYEAFKLGYTRGLQSKWRSLRRDYEVIPKKGQAA